MFEINLKRERVENFITNHLGIGEPDDIIKQLRAHRKRKKSCAKKKKKKMSKRPTFPTEIEDLLKLDVFKFKFKAEIFREGSMTYGVEKFRFEALTRFTGGFLKITHSGGKVWLIGLEAMPSNLGKGIYYYFVCPKTKKRCKALYLYGGEFVHRDLIPFNYSKQNEARKMRHLQRLFDFEMGKVEEQLYKKYFKTHYRGKPTKRFMRIEAKIKRELKFYEENAQSFLQGMIEETNRANYNY